MVLVPRISRWDRSMPRTMVSVSPSLCSTSTAVISPVLNGVGAPSIGAVMATRTASCMPPMRRMSSGLPRKTRRNCDGTNMVLSTSAPASLLSTSGLSGAPATRISHWVVDVSVMLMRNRPSREVLCFAPIGNGDDGAVLDAQRIVDAVGLGQRPPLVRVLVLLVGDRRQGVALDHHPGPPGRHPTGGRVGRAERGRERDRLEVHRGGGPHRLAEHEPRVCDGD